MEKHIVSHNGPPNKQGCDKCNFKTKKKNEMDKHINSEYCQSNTKGCDIFTFKTLMVYRYTCHLMETYFLAHNCKKVPTSELYFY